MAHAEKLQIKEAMEQKRADLTKLIADLKEATKPMGLDNSIGRISRIHQ